MPSVANLLDPADRQRLEQLADPNRALAEAARAAVAESAGTERLALAAVAVGKTRTPAEARTALVGMIEDDQLRAAALGCLAALCQDDTTTRTP